MIGMLPLLLLLIIGYSAFAAVKGAFGGGDASAMNAALDNSVFNINLLSGAEWSMSTGDLFIIIGLILLFAELLKSLRIDTRAIANHGLSMFVFVLGLVLFIVTPAFATSTFFIIIMMTLVDVVAGYTITAVTARRDIGLG